MYCGRGWIRFVSELKLLSVQNEKVYPEKVEMVVDLAQEAFSLGVDWRVHRRHKGVF